MSRKAPRLISVIFSLVVSSAGQPSQTILPLKFFSFLYSFRAVAAAKVLATIQLCPQACPFSFLPGPYPGSASYSARKAMAGPSSSPDSARNDVGISRYGKVTLKPAFAASSARNFEVNLSSFPSSGCLNTVVLIASACAAISSSFSKSSFLSASCST